MAFDAPTVLAALARSGRHAFARDGKLVIEGPPLVAADRALLRVAKDELLEHLASIRVQREAPTNAPNTMDRAVQFPVDCPSERDGGRSR